MPDVRDRPHLADALDELRGRGVNYHDGWEPTADRRDGWHVDNHVDTLAEEPPGPPVEGGPWMTACRLVRSYEFADPRIIQAAYRDEGPLLGRDMLLEGRFLGLRFLMGVRVSEVVDRADERERVWGWAYQTLDGHLEQGKLRYEVVKDLRGGVVFCRISAYSRRAPIDNPFVRLGFILFGRAVQLRFYRAVGRRLRRSVREVCAGRALPVPVRTSEGVLVAPTLPTGRRRERAVPRILDLGK